MCITFIMNLVHKGCIRSALPYVSVTWKTIRGDEEILPCERKMLRKLGAPVLNSVRTKNENHIQCVFILNI